MNEPIGRLGSRESRASATHRVGDRADGVVLSDDPAVQVLLDAEQLLHLAFEHLVERHARPSRDDLGDVLLAHLFLEQRVVALHLDEAGLLLLERALQLVELAVAKLGGAAEVTHLLGAIRLVAHLLHALLDRREWRRAHPSPAPSASRSPRAALLQVGELALEPSEAFLGSRVRLLAQRLALDLELADLAFDDVELGRQRVDLDAQLATRPRR